MGGGGGEDILETLKVDAQSFQQKQSLKRYVLSKP